MKLLLFPLLLALSCLLAGLFGAFHNQISFSVGPEYFSALKFAQFRIPEQFHNRIGAGIVGWHASWWMGLIVGVPALILGMFAPDIKHLFRAYSSMTVTVLFVTLVAGLSGLLIAHTTLTEANIAALSLPTGLQDPIAFAKAGAMHEFSYYGAIVGLFIGIIRTRKWLRRATSS